jgi:transcriptional regulator with GAF, ATPase, and Fis domain
LRVLQEREFERVGGSETLRTDARVVAVSNRDLEEAAREGRFRSDLLFRLNVFPIRVPPLRERAEDIPLLAEYWASQYARKVGKAIEGIDESAMAVLCAYGWPGNIRELQNVIERAVVLTTGRVVDVDPSLLVRATPVPAVATPAIAPVAAAGNGPTPSLVEVETQHLRLALERCNWVIEGERGAAKILGLHPNTLRSRMKKLGIVRPAASSVG